MALDMATLAESMRAYNEAKSTVLAEHQRIADLINADRTIIEEANSRIKAYLLEVSTLQQEAKNLGIELKNSESSRSVVCKTCGETGHNSRRHAM